MAIAGLDRLYDAHMSGMVGSRGREFDLDRPRQLGGKTPAPGEDGLNP
jgi:hypothetical protein